jgi:hypothetical protein
LVSSSKSVAKKICKTSFRFSVQPKPIWPMATLAAHPVVVYIPIVFPFVQPNRHLAHLADAAQPEQHRLLLPQTSPPLVRAAASGRVSPALPHSGL